MTKNRIKNLGRRGLALFLSLVMVTSLMQITVFAAEPSSGKVMDGSFVLNEDGSVNTDAAGTTEGVVSGADHATAVYGDVKLTKSAVKTGENEFEITLQVQTKETVTTNAAAIQLVIDRSTSMDYCSVCGKGMSSTGGNGGGWYPGGWYSGTGGNGGACECETDTVDRMTALKEILTKDEGFLDSLVDPQNGNTGSIYVSVVTYSKGAYLVSDWTDITVGDNLKDLKADINAVSTKGNATNMQAGLMLAYNRLGMDTVKNAGVKYVVMLTDGQANVRSYDSASKNPGSTSSIIEAGDASSVNGTDAGENAAKEMATAVENLANTTLYAVGYGTDKSYLVDNIIADGYANNVFAGSNSADVTKVFENVAKETVSGMNGAGTSVTDPMGKFIVLGDVSGLSGKGVTSSGGTLTWKLNPKQAEKEPVGDTTTYTYSITYPITLNTAAEGFVEDQNYPTNGYTYLSIPQEGGDPRKLAFRVPGVSGKVPEVDWTVEYYLQNADSIGKTPTYPTEPADTKTFKNVDVWTPVNAPDGYETKYASTTGDDYVFASGEVTMQVKPTGENVMRLYYNLVTAGVTVNHYYKTDKINVDGTEVPGSYSETPDTTEGPITWKVNSTYTATPKTVFSGAEYTLDNQMSSDLDIKVTESGNNVINLYYTRVQDDSIKTSAQVNHVYRTYAYVLDEDGKYSAEPVLQGSQTEVAQKATDVYATTRYDVSNQPIDGYKDQNYVLNTNEGNYSTLLQADGTLSFIVDKEANNNIRTLYFDKVIDRRVPVTVTVNHYYTKSVTSIEDGEVVTTVNPNGKLGNSVTFDAYAGEKFTATEINSYEGATYVSDAGNARNLEIAALPNADSVIDLYYSLTKVPEKASVVANHYWRTITEVTVEKTKEVTEEVTTEVTDPDTGEVTTVTETVTKTVVVGTETKDRVTTDKAIEDIEYTNLYKGQKHVEAQKVWEDAEYTYDFNENESVDTVYAGDGKEAIMYYDRADKADERSDASITVQHVYTTHLTTIVGGAVDVVTTEVSSDLEPYTGKAGDSFTATAQPVFDGNTYTQTTAESALSVTLQPGTNATIVINYERQADDRVATSYVVNYEYCTYNMTVVDGVAVYGDPAVETVEGTEIPGYVGEIVTIDDGYKSGFTAVTTHATTQTLAASGNEWTFVYEKYVPLSTGSVTVNHHYSLQTIALDGTVTWTESVVTEDAVVKYLGETYTAKSVLNGYEQMDAILDTAAFAAPYDLTVSGDHVVDFHYKKVVDERKTADYTVTHDYYLYDYDGTLLSHPDPETVTFTGYVAHPVTVNPDDTDYTLTSVTFKGEELTEAPYTQYLVEGENAFVFTYVKTLPQDKVNVKVIHNYYKDEASMNGEAAEVENQYVETITEIPEDTKYTAVEHVLEDAAFTYTWHSADPDTKTITAVDDAENVIIMNYIRATAKYQVIHIYNRNGVEEGRTSETLGGLDGDVVLADSIERVPVFEGRTYTFQSITGDITLDADEMQTITLVYNRKTSGGGGGGGGTIIIPETPVPQDPTPQPEPMPEPEVPLAPAPEEEELFDEEIPLAEAPKTGDAAALWLALSALSGTGLAGVSLLGRKKRED